MDDEDELARLLAEFGIHEPNLETDGDAEPLPNWDDDDFGGWNDQGDYRGEG